MTAFYNEHDPYAAQYLRNLMAAGLIAPGVVDERDIQEIEPWELLGYTQVHMFAGIGIWSGALRAAGWPDDEPIWTGSCPCQPFSDAGHKKGFSDDRHLWPTWRNLAAECRPSRIAGEQVASKDGKIWLDIVSADMEALGLAFGAADLCAAGFGGAHIRQRNYFIGLADFNGNGLLASPGMEFCGNTERDAKSRSVLGGLAEPHSGKCGGLPNTQKCQPDRPTGGRRQSYGCPADDRDFSGMGDASNGDRRRRERGEEAGIGPEDERWRRLAGTNPRGANPSIRREGEALSSHWYDVDWLLCRNPSGEPSWRPVEPGTFPLANGIADRVGKLRAYGNALDFETAKGFCEILVEICLGL